MAAQASGGKREPAFLNQPVSIPDTKVTPMHKAICLNITSIDNPEFDGIKTSPNPVSQQLQIDLTPPIIGGIDYQILDLTGKTLQAAHIANPGTGFRLLVGDLPKGMYILALRDNEGRSWKQKWIKE